MSLCSEGTLSQWREATVWAPYWPLAQTCSYHCSDLCADGTDGPKQLPRGSRGAQTAMGAVWSTAHCVGGGGGCSGHPTEPGSPGYAQVVLCSGHSTAVAGSCSGLLRSQLFPRECRMEGAWTLTEYESPPGQGSPHDIACDSGPAQARSPFQGFTDRA